MSSARLACTSSSLLLRRRPIAFILPQLSLCVSNTKLQCLPHRSLLQPFRQQAQYSGKIAVGDWSAALKVYSVDDLTGLTDSTRREVRKAGLDEKAAEALSYLIAIQIKHKSNVKSIGPDEAYEYLRNYESWKKDPTSVSLVQQRHLNSLCSAAAIPASIWDAARLPKDKAGEAQLGEVLLFLAKQNLSLASRAFGQTGFFVPDQFFLATYLLEMAILCGSLKAAVLLFNLSEDVRVKQWYSILIAAKRPVVAPDMRVARGLISKSVSTDPSQCSWQTVVTYVREDYRESRIPYQTPNQLAWAIDLLLMASENLEPDRSTFKSTLNSIRNIWNVDGTSDISRWVKCENPRRVLRRIVVHCLQHKIKLPNYSASDLQDLMDRCVFELVEYNDPNAAFTIAIRDKEIGTSEWEKLIKCAAVGGIADANWLLASLYLEQFRASQIGLTDVRVLYFMTYAHVAVRQSLADAVSDKTTTNRPSVGLDRILGVVAALKMNSTYENGREFLINALETVKETAGVERHTIHLLEEFSSDYNKISDESGWSWSDERCLEYVDKFFELKRTCNLAKESKDYWG